MTENSEVKNLEQLYCSLPGYLYLNLQTYLLLHGPENELMYAISKRRVHGSNTSFPKINRFPVYAYTILGICLHLLLNVRK